MDLNELKQWHWMVIGLLVGGAVGAIRLWAGPSYVADPVEMIMQGEFEWQVSGLLHPSRHHLLSLDHNYKPIENVAHLTVHPPLDGKTGERWVTGEMRSTEEKPANAGDPKSPMVRAEVWVPFRYPTNSPYTAFTGAKGTYNSVLDYLTAVRQHSSPDLAFAYAWWEMPVWVVILPVAVCFLAIGVVYPASHRLMNRARFGDQQSKDKPYSPSGFSSADTAAKKPAQLLDTESFGMSDSGNSAVAAADSPRDRPATPATAVAKLVAGPIDSPAAAKPEQAADFKGEFYPVAIPKQRDDA